jgi:hypothetical protein
VHDERWFSGEEITTLVASPLSCANDGDEDEDEEEEEEPVWTAADDHRHVKVDRPTSLYRSAVCGGGS